MKIRKKGRVIFFARESDPYSLEIFRLLKLTFRNVEAVWSKTFNEKINLKNLKSCDYIFCFRSYLILKKSTLQKAKIAAINFHPSTPQYRGVGGVNYAVYNKSKYFGVTAHLMDEKIDHGKIFDVVKFKMDNKYSIQNLLEKTHFEQFKQASRIIKNISLQDNYLSHKLHMNKFKWSKKISNLKKLNEFYKIKKTDTKNMIQKKINSTVYKNYLPYILINGKKFILEKKNIIDGNNSKKKHNIPNKYLSIKKNVKLKKNFNLSKVLIRRLSKIYVNEVIELLEKNISSFKPNITHQKLWEKFKKNKNTFAIVALFKKVVVGYGSITFENKIRGGVAGHIEEIVTLQSLREKGIGKKIMDKLFDLAVKNHCYKVVLQSNKGSENFYLRLGFKKVNISMSKRLIK
tara:strand:+ start:140 stop:1348 length:1209 start_codon:yes stop_codon:yes gene_type:complete